MDFDDRLVLFLLGCLIGSVVGYIVRLLQETREKIVEVDEHVQDTHHAPREESGFITFPALKNFFVLAIVAVAAWAAITTQLVNNDLKSAQGDLKSAVADLKVAQADLKKAQERTEHVVFCTSLILSKAIDALNERTTYSGAQADANVELQQAQAEMLGILAHEPPYPEARRDAAIQAYFDALGKFFGLAKKSQEKVEQNDYPTIEEFKACLDAPPEDGKP